MFIRRLIHRPRSNLVSAAIGATVAALLLGGVAVVSAHGGDNSLIHACVRPLTGVVRIVDADASCLRAETPLHWSITGPQGPAGPAGALGIYVVSDLTMNDPENDGIGDFTMFCDAGDEATGGGWVPEGLNSSSVVYQSKHIGSLDSPVGWLLIATGIHEAFGYCLDFEPAH